MLPSIAIVLLMIGQRPPDSPDFAKVDWARELARADRDRGKRLFGREGFGCIRCHSVEPGKSREKELLPNLSGLKSRRTVAQVVESIHDPGRTVAPELRAERITTRDGLEVVGLVLREADGKLYTVLRDGSRKAFHRGEVLDRVVTEASPMPSNLVKTTEDLRDLLGFLMRGSGEGRKEGSVD